MKIRVRFLDDNKRKAEITIEPSWLGRLFGVRARRGEAVKGNSAGFRDREDWFWTTTGRQVDADFGGHPITRALETSEVEPVPTATARERGVS